MGDEQPLQAAAGDTPATPLPAINEHHYWYCVDAKNETIASVKVYERHGVRYMTDVWVDAPHRRKGLATRLITAALARFGHEPLYLHVYGYYDRPLADEQLVAFYERFGFEIVADAPGTMHRPATPGRAVDGELVRRFQAASAAIDTAATSLQGLARCLTTDKT
jgi:ribosomal protein S18 acetylase RimI-like enzyme